VHSVTPVHNYLSQAGKFSRQVLGIGIGRALEIASQPADRSNDKLIDQPTDRSIDQQSTNQQINQSIS